MWLKAKTKAGEGHGKRSKKREIRKEGRYATPFDGASEAVKKGEEENMSLAKRFAQAFLKLDTWCKSTRGLTPSGVIPKSQLPKSQKFGNISIWDLFGSIGSIWIWDFLLAPRRGAV